MVDARLGEWSGERSCRRAREPLLQPGPVALVLAYQHPRTLLQKSAMLIYIYYIYINIYYIYISIYIYIYFSPLTPFSHMGTQLVLTNDQIELLRNKMKVFV